MALVRGVNRGDGTGDPFYEVQGIITLEDIIEVILGDEIIDETDAWVDGEHTEKVHRKDAFDWARLRLLDSKIVDQTLSDDEVRAVAAHLSSNFSQIFGCLSEKQLLRMIAATAVLELKEDVKEVNEFLPSHLMYEKDTPADKCTLILSGKVTVIAGNENFKSNVSSWSLLAPRALTGDLYVPDFSAYVSSGTCRCLQFTREIFGAAAAASELEALPQGFDGTSGNVLPLDAFPIQSSPARTKQQQLLDAHTTAPNQTTTAVEPIGVAEQRAKLLQRLLSENSIHDITTQSERSGVSFDNEPIQEEEDPTKEDGSSS